MAGKEKPSYWFFAIMMLFFIGFFIVENINNRFWLNDFKVYYSASSAFVNGGQVYGVPFGLGSGYYKYSPFILFLFVPFAALSYAYAKVLYFAVLCSAIFFSIKVSAGLVKDLFFNSAARKERLWAQYIMFVACLLQFYYELHLGNVNSLLLLLVITAAIMLKKDRQMISGVLVGLAILVKPHFLLLLPLLFVRRKFVFVVPALAVIAAGLVFPAVYTGWGHNIELHRQWLETMMLHNQNPVNGFDTIYSWVYRLISPAIHFEAGKLFSMVVFVFVYGAVLLFVAGNSLWSGSKKINTNDTKNQFFEFFLVLALIPNLTVTDFEHFMFSMPLIAFLVYYWVLYSPSLFFRIVVVAGLLMFGGNIRELVGKSISAWMTSTGILGLGNMLIVAAALIAFINLRKKTSEIAV